MGYDYELEERLQEYIEGSERRNIEAFSLKYATDNQEQAIRDYANAVGFTDLRMFKGWMHRAELDYYDILKIQSPDD